MAMGRDQITSFSRLSLLIIVLLGHFLSQALSSPLLVPSKGSNDNSRNAPGQHHLGKKPNHNDLSQNNYPSWFTSTLLARRLLALSTTGSVSTIFPDPLPNRFPYTHVPADVAGQSISLKEYIADCDEYTKTDDDGGNPTFLALHVATTFSNIANGSKNISLSIDWWDHLKDAEPVYPGLPSSPAGLPRATLLGYVEPIPSSSKEEEEETEAEAEEEGVLEKCYLAAHPDAEVWLPRRDGSPHSSFWARLVVTQVYWVGGFGDVARIGWLDVGDWKGIGKEGSRGDVGDGSGRGWDDVRLPGERY